jgi:hypothetical protein
MQEEVKPPGEEPEAEPAPAAPPRPRPEPFAPSTTAWALHSFGYRAGLPGRANFTSRLVFETARRIVVVNMTNEPQGSPGVLTITPIGPARAVFSVVADAPTLSHRHRVLGVEVEIDGIRGGAISFSPSDEASPERSHSIILGDPTKFTYDREERLAIRNAVWRVEDRYLSGELTRQTIPGLQPDLLLESDETRRIPDRAAFNEICRQLAGAVRADTWGYLWKWEQPPSPADGSALALSNSLTISMSQHLLAVTETLLRACGAKPLTHGFETGTDVLDTVAYALVAMRRGVALQVAARHVLAAIHRYGEEFDLERLRRST